MTEEAWEQRIALAREAIAFTHDTRRAFGLPSRGVVLLAVFAVCRTQGDATASEIARAARLPRTSVLAQLKALARAGMVSVTRSDRGFCYTPTVESKAVTALVIDRHHRRVKIILSKTDR